MTSIRLSFRIDSILSREIPFLNLTNSSYGMNRGVWDFPGRSKVDVGVAFRVFASQDVENHKTDAHITIGASRISRSGKGSKDIVTSLPQTGFIILQVVDKAQFMVEKAASCYGGWKDSRRWNAPLAAAAKMNHGCCPCSEALCVMKSPITGFYQQPIRESDRGDHVEYR